MSAIWHQLVEGYVRDGGSHVASSVVYVADEGFHIIIDPGMVASQANILDPLGALGVEAGEITDVVISHHHPDHTMNIALFPNARVHSATSIYQGDSWHHAAEPNRHITQSVRLIATPGHQPEDISVVIDGQTGLVVYTHEWWMESGPAEDPYAADRDLLRASRQAILDLKPVAIIPAHGPAFAPNANTPL